MEYTYGMKGMIGRVETKGHSMEYTEGIKWITKEMLLN